MVIRTNQSDLPFCSVLAQVILYHIIIIWPVVLASPQPTVGKCWSGRPNQKRGGFGFGFGQTS